MKRKSGGRDWGGGGKLGRPTFQYRFLENDNQKWDTARPTQYNFPKNENKIAESVPLFSVLLPGKLFFLEHYPPGFFCFRLFWAAAILGFGYFGRAPELTV